MGETTQAVDLAVVIQRVDGQESMIQRLSAAVEKIGDATTSINTMLTVHKEQISGQVQNQERLENSVNKNREDTSKEIHEVYDSIRKSGETIGLQINQSEERITKSVTTLAETVQEKTEKVETRLSKLERWRWMLLGVGAAIVFILEKFEILQKLFKP